MEHEEIFDYVCRWWRDEDMAKVEFFRHRHVEYYFFAVTGTFEPQFSQSRIAFAKICVAMTILDDLYDTYGTLEELRPFTEAMKR